MEERTIQKNSTDTEKKSILVIDDCEDVLDLQRVVLEQNGYTVFTAQSGNEAMEILTEITQPNLILLDMNLTDMTGIDFLKELENENPKIIEKVPVVIFSGTDTVPESKAVGFIHKPYDLEKFIAEIKIYLEMGFSIPMLH
tara:strand:- start:27076 stop:27498 length:423 start_codon:yes stop_codon:yes gene_type:complete